MTDELSDVKAIGARFAFPAPTRVISDGGRGFAGMAPGEHGGMSIREYAAIAAMQGLVITEPVDDAQRCQEVARGAVNMADALLAELAKEPPR